MSYGFEVKDAQGSVLLDDNFAALNAVALIDTKQSGTTGSVVLGEPGPGREYRVTVVPQVFREPNGSNNSHGTGNCTIEITGSGAETTLNWAQSGSASTEDVNRRILVWSVGTGAPASSGYGFEFVNEQGHTLLQRKEHCICLLGTVTFNWVRDEWTNQEAVMSPANVVKAGQPILLLDYEYGTGHIRGAEVLDNAGTVKANKGDSLKSGNHTYLVFGEHPQDYDFSDIFGMVVQDEDGGIAWSSEFPRLDAMAIIRDATQLIEMRDTNRTVPGNAEATLGATYSHYSKATRKQLPNFTWSLTREKLIEEFRLVDKRPWWEQVKGGTPTWSFGYHENSDYRDYYVDNIIGKPSEPRKRIVFNDPLNEDLHIMVSLDWDYYQQFVTPA